MDKIIVLVLCLLHGPVEELARPEGGAGAGRNLHPQSFAKITVLH